MDFVNSTHLKIVTVNDLNLVSNIRYKYFFEFG